MHSFQEKYKTVIKVRGTPLSDSDEDSSKDDTSPDKRPPLTGRERALKMHRSNSRMIFEGLQKQAITAIDYLMPEETSSLAKVQLTEETATEDEQQSHFLSMRASTKESFLA
jgi:hypothetical protein